MEAAQSGELFNIHQAAAAAGRTEETLRRWVWSGRLRASKQGNRLMVLRAEVERLANPRASRKATSLATWMAELEASRPQLSAGVAPKSTADLILEDRARRSGLEADAAGR